MPVMACARLLPLASRGLRPLAPLVAPRRTMASAPVITELWSAPPTPHPPLWLTLLLRVFGSLLRYSYVEGMLEKRDPFRPGHIAHARAAAESGALLVAGALADPVDEALFIWSGGSAEAAEEFARTDPYVLNGLVPEYDVRTWSTVIGGDKLA